MLYVFVDIKLNVSHFVDTLKANFATNLHIALVSTIQFVRSLHDVQKALSQEDYKISIPQCKPLSPGEILGCTSPKVPKDIDVLV